MGSGLYTVHVLLARLTLVSLLLCGPALAGGPESLTIARWSEGGPGCSLSRSKDGRTYYGISTPQFEITLGVDNQELEKIKRRTVPMVGVLLSLSSKSTEPLPVMPSQSTLEFVKHFQVAQRALNPDAMLTQLQKNMDDLTDEITRHQVKKHPEQKDAKEAELQQRLKDYTDMMDFVSTHALRDHAVDASNTSTSGWVFFSTKNRWIGPWRRPEQFVLRIPAGNAMIEFPFELPPRGGKAELRSRPE